MILLKRVEDEKRLVNIFNNFLINLSYTDQTQCVDFYILRLFSFGTYRSPSFFLLRMIAQLSSSNYRILMSLERTLE